MRCSVCGRQKMTLCFFFKRNGVRQRQGKMRENAITGFVYPKSDVVELKPAADHPLVDKQQIA